MRPLCAGILAVVLLAPAQAGAATVTLAERQLSGRYEQYADAVVTVLAADGERNEVTVSGDTRAVVVHDRGAPLEAGAGCAGLADGGVRCTGGPVPINELIVRLGDLADRAADAGVEHPIWLRVEGGAGDDELLGGPRRGAALDGGAGDDRLTGGPNADSLGGGPGSDVLLGAGGDDHLAGDASGAPFASDVLDGGAGVDTVSYADRSEPVLVDLLTPGDDGSAGERDSVVATENVEGGRAADVLRGDDGPNRLSGRTALGPRSGDVLDGRGGDDELHGADGPDTLTGGPGDDRLHGWAAADRLAGGPGDDLVDLGSYAAGDRATCGTGTDRVPVGPRPTDLVASDCERTQVGRWLLAPPRRLRGGGFLVRLWDSRTSPPFPCVLRVEAVTAGGRWSSRSLIPPRRGAVVVRVADPRARLARGAPRPGQIRLLVVSRCQGRFAIGGFTTVPRLG